MALPVTPPNGEGNIPVPQQPADNLPQQQNPEPGQENQPHQEAQAQEQTPLQAPAPQEQPQRPNITPEQARDALPVIRRRIEELRTRIATLPAEHSGRYSQPEAAILRGYVERVRSQVANPDVEAGNRRPVGFGNRSARELADNFNNSGHAAQFRTPDNARQFILEIGRQGVLVENAQERVELRQAQLRAVRNLSEQLAYQRDRNNVSTLVDQLNTLEGRTNPALPENVTDSRRTYEEWERVIQHETRFLQRAVGNNQLTQQEVDNYLQLRRLQRDNLASTDRAGSVRSQRDLVNPVSIPAYRTLNELNDQGEAVNGQTLYQRVQTLIGQPSEITISGADLTALRRASREGVYINTEVGFDPQGNPIPAYERVNVQGTGRLTTAPEDAHLESLLRRALEVFHGIEGQVTDANGVQYPENYQIDPNGEYRITGNTPAEQAISELTNVQDYLRDTALWQANERLTEERRKFDNMAGDIELSADPNIRTTLEQELAQSEARERELSAIARGEQPPTENAAVNPEAQGQNQELLDRIADLQRQLDEERARRSNSRQRWLKIGTFVAGAVAGVALVASSVPVATVAGLAMISGGTSILSKLANRFIFTRNVDYLRNSQEARENLTEEERARRIRNNERISNALSYVAHFTSGFALTAGLGSAIENWISGHALNTAGSEISGKAAEKGMEEGARGAAHIGEKIASGGSEIVAGAGDSQWSLIEKVLRQAYPNLSNDQILNATGNIIQRAGPEQIYSQVFANRTADIVGGSIQIGDKLGLSNLTQIAPDIINSLSQQPSVFVPVT